MVLSDSLLPDLFFKPKCYYWNYTILFNVSFLIINGNLYWCANSQTECQKETVLVSPSMGNHQRLGTSLNGLDRCGWASKIPIQLYLFDLKELQCFVLLLISGLSVMVGQVDPIFSGPMGVHSYSNGHIYDQGIYFTGKSMWCFLYHILVKYVFILYFIYILT